MFLYPSGTGLHVGHPRGYTAVDIIARMKKMQGYEVCHPIGWDSFGLPAEQYAIKHNIHPKKAILENIQRFRLQLQALGFSYDYSLEVNTADDDILAETQKMFQYLLKNKYAKKTVRKSNWSNRLQTVIANEETYTKNDELLTKIGDFPVTQINLEQWIIRISWLGSELLEGLKILNWPQKIILQQKKWIGEQNVFVHKCTINGIGTQLIFANDSNVYQCYGIFLPIDSPIIDSLFLPKKIELKIQKLRQKSDLQRAKEVPAIIKLGVSIIIQNKRIFLYAWSRFSESQRLKSWMITKKNSLIEQIPEKFFKQKTTKITNLLNCNFVTKKRIYKLQDWIFSRQRYWGEPFPIYYDKNGKLFFDDELPLKLPDYEGKFSEIGKKSFPLKQIAKWFKFKIDNQEFSRDPCVMPQWAGSSWYYIAYLWQAAKNIYGPNIKLRDERTIKIINKFLPVDLYIGGKEHAVLHLIYARFWHKVLKQSKLVNCEEPFLRLETQGLILGKNLQKMSKSRGNVINPDELILKFGADALRCYEMFIAPLDKDIKWDDRAIFGIRKWLDRFVKMFYKFSDPTKIQLTTENEQFFQKTIGKIEHDYAELNFNTAISKFMIMTNYCYKLCLFPDNYLKDVLIMFSCICPFICEELWSKQYKEKRSIFFAKWPKKYVNNNDIKTIKVIVQQNHRLRFVIELTFNYKWSQKQLIDQILHKVRKNKKFIQNREKYQTMKYKLHLGKSAYILNFS